MDGYAMLPTDMLAWPVAQDPATAWLLTVIVLLAAERADLDATLDGTSIKASLTLLQESSGLSRQQVRTALRRLQDNGLISVAIRERTNVITLNIVQSQHKNQHKNQHNNRHNEISVHNTDTQHEMNDGNEAANTKINTKTNTRINTSANNPILLCTSTDAGTHEGPLTLAAPKELTPQDPLKRENKQREKAPLSPDKKKQPSADGLTAREAEAMFEAFRKAYKGTKRGHDVELMNFRTKNRDWKEIVPLLMPALEREIAFRRACREKMVFCPEWAHLQTWLNQKRWTTEYADAEEKAASARSGADALRERTMRMQQEQAAIIRQQNEERERRQEENARNGASGKEMEELAERAVSGDMEAVRSMGYDDMESFRRSSVYRLYCRR